MNEKIVTKHNYKINDKVVKGRDWKWYDQDKGSDYGIITDTYLPGWVVVNWVREEDGMVLERASYRVEAEGCYDLYFYDDSMFRTLDGKLKTTL